MPVTGPLIQENDDRVNKAFSYIMNYLEKEYGIQKFPANDLIWNALRLERNEVFKEALWKLFELNAWESF